MAPVSLVALRCRTSDRTEGAGRGVDELAPLLAGRLGTGARVIGSPEPPRTASFDEDLASSRGCLLEAGGQVDDALAVGAIPLLLAGDCSVALTTLPVVAARRPDARVLWLDAHADFNVPASTPSGFLGGMCLAGACGRWNPGLAAAVDPRRVVLAGVRELDPGERAEIEAAAPTVIGASLETLVFAQNALDRAPVYVHLDLDVLDPAELPAQFPAPGGLVPDKLFDLLEAVAGECEIVGIEVAAFEAQEDQLERDASASVVLHVLEPLLAVLAGEEAGVGR